MDLMYCPVCMYGIHMYVYSWPVCVCIARVYGLCVCMYDVCVCMTDDLYVWHACMSGICDLCVCMVCIYNSLNV